MSNNGQVDWQRLILGGLADLGYRIRGYPDHTITIEYKDDVLGAYSEPDATAMRLLAKAQSHYDKIATPAGAAQ